MLSIDQLTGVDERHLTDLPGGHRLHPEAARAWQALVAAARAAGFQLQIASSHRSFSRQSGIWNAKAAGKRAVHDDCGQPVAMASLSPREQLHAILRFSALPGTSRHHWGTDLDVFDAAAVPAGYAVQLTPEEVAPGGPFDALHTWLDQRMAAGESQGFFRPYARDRGGVAPERWHLSYAPLSLGCGERVGPEALRACWDRHLPGGLLLRSEVEAELDSVLARYVAVGEGWCPAVT
ncbi:M15 family metallopeptidase [Parahaliea maris]|uniref:M15 family metallopeptidase n=1 Tax=Parahaliea maris TaxID=2716870 RepID=A0A5C9A6Y2_9GAMM|nr:M15 family metallopeptidase [Parahaliea maris]TXS96436.1 M15 family metallopeptidase [Parahaliea maris]